MTTFYGLLSVFVSAMVVENLVFARAVGMDGILERTRTYRLIGWSGGLVAALSTMGATLAWLLTRQLSELPSWRLLRYPVLLLCLSVSYVVLSFGLGMLASKKSLQPSHSLVRSVAYNGAAFGSMLLALSVGGGLIETLVRCLGFAAGLTVAMLLVHSGRERLSFSAVPRSFRGLPVTLLYIGILSLAIYGLIGHQLPT